MESLLALSVANLQKMALIQNVQEVVLGWATIIKLAPIHGAKIKVNLIGVFKEDTQVHRVHL